MLDAVVHKPILDDFERICAIAGVQGSFLHGTMYDHCGPVEIEWVRQFNRFRREGVPGVLLQGVRHPHRRCQAIAAALVRNFVDARVMPLNTVLDLAKDQALPMPTVLLIPNLQVTVVKLPPWRLQILFDVLLDRVTHNKPSVIYVENLQGLKRVYGTPMWDFVSSFLVVQDTPEEETPALTLVPPPDGLTPPSEDHP